MKLFLILLSMSLLSCGSYYPTGGGSSAGYESTDPFAKQAAENQALRDQDNARAELQQTIEQAIYNDRVAHGSDR